MRDDEISEHCLCDKCAGHECGADNPEERAAEEKRAREVRDNQMREEGAKAEREKWRDGHPDDLVWMTPEEEEERIRKDEREQMLKRLQVLEQFGNLINSHVSKDKRDKRFYISLGPLQALIRSLCSPRQEQEQKSNERENP